MSFELQNSESVAISMWRKNLKSSPPSAEEATSTRLVAAAVLTQAGIPCVVWGYTVSLPSYSTHSTFWFLINSKKRAKLLLPSPQSAQSQILVIIMPMAGYSRPERGRRRFKSWADFYMLHLYLGDSFLASEKEAKGPPHQPGKLTFLNTLPSHQIPFCT